MKNTKILHKHVLKKIFGSAKHELYNTLFSKLSEAAAQKDYLENLTASADAIHWHLNRVDILDFEIIMREYFNHSIKELRKSTSFQKVTIAFDETFIPFYGEITNNWVVGYTNKVKGAKGSYKFMVCSIVAQNKRYVLGIMPMHNCQDTNATVDQMLEQIKSKFSVDTVLFDRGFCNKNLCRNWNEKALNISFYRPSGKILDAFLKKSKTKLL